MTRNGTTWPGTLLTVRKIFRISKPPHPLFGRFKRFLRRRERRPAHSPPPLATTEGDLDLSRHPSSVFSRRAVTNHGGSSADTNDLGFGYDINTSLPFLDVATTSADRDLSADEYNPYQNYASTSSAPSPLSALTGLDLKDFPSSTSAGSSEMDVALQHSLMDAGALLSAANPTASTSQAGPSAHSFLSGLQPPDALGPQSTDYSEESVVRRPRSPQMNCVPLPLVSPSEVPSIPSIHTGESTNGQYDYETIYETPLVANDDEPTNEQYQGMTPRSSASSCRTPPEGLSSQREHQPEMVLETLGM